MRIKDRITLTAALEKASSLIDAIVENGQPVGVKFDGEFLRSIRASNARADSGEYLIGIYDPLSALFDREAVKDDIIMALDEMGAING